MPSSKNGGNIKFGIDFEANQASLNKLKKSLQDLQKIKPGNFEGSREELQRIQKEALQVERALNRAFNPTLKTTNISAFKAELESNGITIKQLSADMASLGPAGVKAFGLMTTEILTTNLQLKETNSLIDSMGKTMINTVKWGIASSVMNSFTQSVQGAFQYVQSLEKSLTNIRIVTGDSTERMAQFAEQANRSAQALGRSTLDYTKASLTYYQQGLNEEDVQARTEATLKAQNITGAGSQMADYLTSVWNGYKVANEEAELYVDKLAAVADSSASDMSQLAIAMSKVASTANTMGVDIDQLNAQIATVVATTRQAPESVGTAYKTIYTRMNDIKTGSEEAEISLGRYSGIMAELGFNVLDATGHLRDTGQVMDEIGGRWQELTREQQIYLAQTMGGQRQVNQLMALFDNWTTYSELLNTSLESEGTLAEKNARYMESLGAKMEQLGAAGERVKASFLTADMINPILTGLTGATNLLGSFIEAIGGGVPALMGLSSAMLQAFGPVISREINSVITNMQNVRENATRIAEDIKLTKQLNDQIGQKGKDSGINEQAISNITQEITERKEVLRDYYSIMEAGEINAYNAIVKSIGEQKTESEILKIRIQNAENLANGIVKVKEEIDATTKEGQQLLESLSPDNIQGTLGIVEQELDNLKNTVRSMSSEDVKKTWTSLFGQDSDLAELKVITELIPGFQNLDNAIKKVIQNGDAIDINLKDKIINFAQQASQTIKDLDEQTLDNLKNQLKDVENNLSQAQKQADQFVEKMQQISLAKSFTEILQGTTRLMSGFTSLGGVIDTVFDKKVPTVEKFSKTIMGLGYAVPSIVSGFNALQKSMGPIAAHFLNQTQILEKYNNLQQVNNTIKAAQAVLNKGVASSEMTVAQAQTIAASAKQMSAAAQHSLNAAMLAFPGTWLVAGIVAITAALTIIPKIYDAVTMSAEQAQQAIQNFNNAQKESSQKYAQTQSDIKILSEAEDEWNRLSKAAGDYNSTIDNLTEEEKERYYELSNLIANYNSSAVIGYDAQGNAIINKNTNLKEQIQLINQAAQAERRRFYNSDEYRQGVKGQKKQEELANQAVETSQIELNNTKTAYASEMRSSITSALSTLSKDNQEKIDRYNELLKADEDTLIANEQEVYKMLLEDQERLKSVYGDKIGGIGFVQSVQQASQRYKDKQLDTKNLQKDAKAASQLNYQTLFDQLSLNSDAYNQLKELGITNVEGLITSYVEGADQAFSRANLGADTYKSAAQKLNQEILEPFMNSFNQIQQNGESINLNDLINNFVTGGVIDDDNLIASSFAEKQQKTQNLIEQFFAQNKDFISNIAVAVSNNPQLEKIWEDYFANLFNIENIDIDFDNQKVNQITNSALERLQNNVNNAILNSNIGGKSPINVGQFLHGDYSDSELDYITNKFVELYDGTKPVQSTLAEIEASMHDISVASSGVQALNLLNKDSLTDKQVEALKSSLASLIQQYPQLTKEVTILNTEWLKGTSAYENALTTVTNAVINSYGNLVSAGQMSQKQAYGAIEGFITNTENLQHAQNEGIAVGIDYHNKLGEIGSQYASCKDELERYVQAVNTKDQAQIKAAQFDMELATRAAENSELYGLQAERVESLAEQYVRYAEQGRVGYEGLNENAELAADAATRYIRLNDAVADLGKNYEELAKMAQQVSEGGLEEALAEHDDLFKTVKEDVADIVDTSEQLLGDDWIADHMNQILEAAQGNEEAIESLRESAQDEIITNLGINFDGFEEGKERFLNDLNQLEDGADLMVKMDLDDIAYLQKLVTAMQQAGMAQSEIQSALSGLGIDVDLAPYEQGLNEVVDKALQTGLLASDAFASTAGVDSKTVSQTDQATDNVEYAGHTVDVSPVYGSQVTFPIQATTIPGSPIPAISSGPAQVVHPSFPQVTVTPTPVSTEVSKETTSTALEVIGARKSSGGHLSHTNKSGGNKKAGKGGGGGKKGGGGGKGSQPKQPNHVKPETKKADRYHDNTVRANKLANNLTKLNKQHERLTGKDALDNLNKQLDVLEQQNENIKERIGLEKDELAELKNQLTPYGAKFNADGSLANYEDTFNKIMNQYNNSMKIWNTASAEWQQENKDFADNAKKKMEEMLKVLEDYDKVVDKIAKSRQDLIDNAQAQIDKKVQTFKIELQAELDLTKVRRDLNEFRKEFVEKIRDDDILGQNRFNFKDLSTYFNGGSGSIEYLSDRLQELLPQENFFSAVYNDGKNVLIDDAARVEQIKNIMDELSSEMGDFKQIVDAIKESIFDAIDAAQDAFDEQMDEYEFLGDLLDHNQKITEMLFGDKAYDQMEDYYKAVGDNNNKQLDFLSKQKDLWYSRMDQEQKRMQNIAATQGADSNEYKQAEQRFKEYEKHWIDSTKNLNSMVEDSLKNILDKYNNAIDKALLNLELKLGNGKIFDDIEDEWDRINDQADMYLDKINSAYEIDKLQNAYQDAIKDNDGNIAAQQALNDLMEQQLAYLKDKDKLTQYDVDRANTLLQIEMKRLALEQSRSNKNRLRLRRDSQGNYTYQYTADTESINKAEQELADVKISLYNADKAAYVDNLNSIQKSAENIKSRLEDIWKDQNLSQEQKLKKSYELQKYYGDIINDLLADNASIRNNLINSAFEDIEKRFGITREQFNQFSKEEQDKYLSMYIPQINSATAQLVDKFIGEGGIGGMFQDFIDEARQVERDKVNSISMLEQSQREGLIKDYDTLTKQAKALLEDNDKLTQAQAKNLTEIQNSINAVNQLTKAYEECFETATKAYTQGAALLEKQDREILGLTRTDENQKRVKNDALFNEWTGRTNSGGDIPNYTPYQSNWSGTSYAALYGSTSIDQADYLFERDKLANQVGQKIREVSANQNLSSEEKRQQLLDLQKEYAMQLQQLDDFMTNNIIDSLNNDVFTSINDTLNNILKSNQEYYTKSLTNQESIIKSIVANQDIHIDADFPNAKDVYDILQAMENLAAAAAQKAGSITKKG